MENLPFVSLCTPTYNRRPFLAMLIRCMEAQTYPLNRMEWVVVDDGTDCVEDLFKDCKITVKYHRVITDTPLLLGKKRNLIHSLCSGDIMVNIDDDDYYPPTRVSHAVEQLTNSEYSGAKDALASEYLVCGSSKMYICINDLVTERNMDNNTPEGTIIRCGPYGKWHATAATFAFKRALLDTCTYDETLAIGEEKSFLKGYTVPLLQLDPKQTILVFSHEHNSFDKHKLLEKPKQFKVCLSDCIIYDFIDEYEITQFYCFKIHELLRDYPAGLPENKKEMLAQIRAKEIKLNANLSEISIETLQKQLVQKDLIIEKMMEKIKNMRAT